MVLITEWVAEIEIWGNYDLTDGDLIHGWDMAPSDLGGDIAPYPDFIGNVHGDGTCGRLHPYNAITLLATQHSKVTSNLISSCTLDHQMQAPNHNKMGSTSHAHHIVVA